MPAMVSSEEAARRLGVKLPTIYAYVSRGLLVSHRSADGRRSLFDMTDLDALARRSRTGPRTEGRLATVATAVTEIRDQGPIYRGHPAGRLAETESFEVVADLLWQVGAGAWVSAPIGPATVQSFSDRLRWAVVMSGSVDPLRSDLRNIAVGHAARTIIASMVASLGGPGSSARNAATMAGQLAGVFVASPSHDLTEAVRAALVLLADHELASSTVAVRIAASTRSDVYDAVLAGLGTVNGPLHGGASRQAHILLEDAERRGGAAALDDSLKWQRGAPGFGHFLYDRDPRFDVLFPFLERLVPTSRLEVVASVIDLASTRGLPHPNIDLGLAALSFVSGMDPEAGSVIFKVARVAGWVAHYLEELTETPLRYRARAVYVTSK